MYQSRFVPVNVNRQNAAVFTEKQIYPAQLLKDARAVLATGACIPNVIVESGIISFISNPEYKWTIPNIYCACEALDAAETNNFSFYSVLSVDGVPQLFISKAFKGCRILMNALTFQTQLITKQHLVRKLASMVDKRYDITHCINIFNTLVALENGAVHYLDALIVNRGSEEESMCISPMTMTFAEEWDIYGACDIEDLRQLVSRKVTDTEGFYVENNKVRCHRVESFPKIPIPYAQDIVNLYDRLLEKKCNYLCLMGTDFECYYYISTNWQYLVDAKTFEVITIKNQQLRSIIQGYIAAGNVPPSKLKLCWDLAKTRVGLD